MTTAWDYQQIWTDDCSFCLVKNIKTRETLNSGKSKTSEASFGIHFHMPSMSIVLWWRQLYMTSNAFTEKFNPPIVSCRLTKNYGASGFSQIVGKSVCKDRKIKIKTVYLAELVVWKVWNQRGDWKRPISSREIYISKLDVGTVSLKSTKRNVRKKAWIMLNTNVRLLHSLKIRWV